MLSPEYLAGFLDGEGCFQLVKEKAGSVSVRIQVGVTYLPVLQLMRDVYGGGISARKHNSNKQLWHWYTSGEQAYKLCKSIRPWVMEKKPQVDLIIRFFEWRQEQAYRQPNWSEVYWMLDELRRLKVESHTA